MNANPTPGRAPFPTTRWSMIRTAADSDSARHRQSLEHLAGIYWRPVYSYFRVKWSASDEKAKDLTQDFFAALCEKDFLQELSPEKGRFRSYVMTSLDNFVRAAHRYQSRLKRGGNALHFPMEWTSVEPMTGETPERLFQREWARSILHEGLAEMQKQYQESSSATAFALFMARDVNPVCDADTSYEGLAKQFALSVTDVTNLLFKARKKLRELVLSKVRDTVSSEKEAEDEMRELFDEN